MFASLVSRELIVIVGAVTTSDISDDRFCGSLLTKKYYSTLYVYAIKVYFTYFTHFFFLYLGLAVSEKALG